MKSHEILCYDSCYVDEWELSMVFYEIYVKGFLLIVSNPSWTFQKFQSVIITSN